MPQPKKSAAKKAAKRKPAARRQPEPPIQTNRTPEEPTVASDPPQDENTPPTGTEETRLDGGDAGQQEGTDDNGETQADRDAAGEARRRHVRREDEGAPQRQPLEHAGFDQHGAEAERQNELTRARELHNRNTAGYAKA